MILMVTGFPDFMDMCPIQPETFNGIDDKDGCPDDDIQLRDTDQDGISDPLDACPLEPETYNRYLDSDGCPDSVDAIDSQYTFPDTDGDGIEDRWDSCIHEPENYNDYLDHDGCPDVPGITSLEAPDADYDGILDDVDDVSFRS